MDWSLRTCARKGHITYKPTETDLADHLRATTPHGEAWRCLRCGGYVLGTPHGSGPADRAPLVLRGRALRDLLVLRLLAVERAGRGLLILLLAYGVLRFRSSQATLRQLFEQDLPAARPLADKLNINLDESGVVHTIRTALGLQSRTLVVVALALAAYALLGIVEGAGLWYAKRWAEYLAVVATSAFLPLEVYELIEKVTVLRVSALVFNIAAVVYLLLSKRLFGLRGGHAAFEAARHSESLLEVRAVARTRG
ncbi:MAG: DUF2127 domain-containing protein [Actinobacteria bacterium]|nr:DUF2127 domain-containing protein [Actinomycetota bacterium]